MPHDSLQAGENVAVASMLNTKYLIIAGIGLTNYDHIEWTKSSTACNGTIPGKNKIDYSIGVNNLLNTRYIDHLSRLKTYEIPNPGRNIYFKLSLTI